MTNLEAIDELNKRLDQAAALVEMVGSRDFGNMTDEAREIYASTLADSIEQAKRAVSYLE